MSCGRVVVVGGGIAGLVAAHTLVRSRPGLEVVVLERDSRVGGLIETEHTQDGFVIEHGPDSIVAHDPQAIELVDELGLSSHKVVGRGARGAFVVHDGALVALPTGLFTLSPSVVWSMLRTPLLSMKGKLRLGLEPLVARRSSDDDESVASFFSRRCGVEVAERLAAPVFGGVYGTSPDELSLLSTLPRIAGLEREHGSLAAAMAKRAVTRASSGTQAFSLRGGMATLTDSLGAALGDRVRLGVDARRLDRDGEGLVVQTDVEPLTADAVIIATPTRAAAALLDSLDSDLARTLGAVPAVSHVCVTLGFEPGAVSHPMNGTGFLVPTTESDTCAACTWSSRKWPGRAPSGTVLLRAFMRDSVSAERALPAARRALRALMGIEAPPVLTRVRLLDGRLPRRLIGHQRTMNDIEARTSAAGPIALAGSAAGVVGIPNCILSAQAAASRVLDATASGAKPARAAGRRSESADSASSAGTPS